jgi:methyl-accepting chemotaxis protein
MTVQERVGIACGILCFVMFIFGLFSVKEFLFTAEISEAISNDSVKGIISIGMMDSGIAEMEIQINRLFRAETQENINLVKNEMEKLEKRNNDALRKYEATIYIEENREKYSDVKKFYDNWENIRKQAVQLIDKGELREDSNRFLNGKVVPAYDSVIRACDSLAEYDITMYWRKEKQMSDSIRRGLAGIVTGLVISLVLGVALSIFTARNLSLKLKQIAESISENSEQTAGASDMLSSSSQSLAENSAEQAASLEQSVSSLESLSDGSKQNLKYTEEAEHLALRTRNTAESGQKEMERMITAMNEIKAAGNNIAKITKTIEEIAFQTNILSLNAAVEAACAGEAGQGFAVVAGEVRSLAQRCSGAAKEIAGTVEDMILKIQDGSAFSTESAKCFEEIAGNIRRLTEFANHINSVSVEQSGGIEQISTAVSQMQKTAQSNAASSEEFAGSAEELNAQAEQLKMTVQNLMKMVSRKKA